MATPLVSVIVPAWNAEATIAETLRSVASQTYRDIEILIVDDGSTDNTVGIARDFCRTENRARLIKKENGGVASARNRGIAEARGDWVAPIDADDLWHPSKLEKQIAAALRATESPGFVYCWFHYVEGNGRVIGTRRGWAADGLALNQLAYENIVGNGSALLIRRTAVSAVGGYDESMRANHAQGCEDLLLQLMVARDHPIACVPEYLVGYRVSPDTMSRNAEEMRRSWALVYDWLRRYAPSVPRHVIRWSKGIRSFEFAEASAIASNWPRALLLLARALWLDPLRCGALFLYRLSRLGVRLARGRRDPPPRPLFGEVQLGETFQSDPDELTGFVRLLEAVDRRRLAGLARRDLGTNPSRLRTCLDRLNKQDWVQFGIRSAILPFRVQLLKRAEVSVNDDLVVLSVVRDAAPWIPAFLEHHRRLGVRQFVFLDNGSGDNTVAVLRNEADVTLLTTKAPYHAYENTMKRFLVDRFGVDRWCLFVDADELFDWPLRHGGKLSNLIGYLDRNGFDAVVCQLLDLFPLDGMDSADFSAGPQRACTHYDVTDVERTEYPFWKTNRRYDPGIKMHWGGIRRRLFGTRNGLTKVSLFKSGADLEPFHMWHHVRNASIADVTCVLYHYALTPSLAEKAHEAVMTGRYGYLTSNEYSAYDRSLRRNPNPDFASLAARELGGPDELLESGFLYASETYREWFQSDVEA